MLRILKSRFSQITERGSEFIQKWIVKCVKEDGFVLILVYGDRGLGKSTLGLNIVYNSLMNLYPEYDDTTLWEKTVKHTIFTIEDFDNATNRKDILKWEDGRIPILLWDDFALHTSSYGFLRGEGDKIGEFLENFETVREDIAVIVITCATPEMIPPKMRESPQVYIKLIKRGVGKIYVKEDDKEGRTLWDKILVWRYTIKWNSAPKEYYNRYKELKRKAHEIKKMQRLLRKKEKAKELAEKITEWEWKDKTTLHGYGILDTFDNITGFGELVIRSYVKKFGRLPPLPEDIISNIDENIGAIIENEIKRVNFAEQFSKVISQRKFEMLLRSCGIRGDTYIFRNAYRELIRYLEKNGNNYPAEVMN